MKKEKPKLKTIGSDIEFGLVDRESGDVISAERTFGGDHEEARKHAVGWDGHSTTGEMRPKPFISGNFTPMYKSIFEALEYINKVLEKNVIVVAGCATQNRSNEPIGGHIHFGNVDNKLMKDMLPRLDLYLALPLMLMENKEHALTRRSGGGYGRLSNSGDTARRKSLHDGFEYRTPSSYILTPGMTKITMALSDIVLRGTMMGRLPVFYKMSNDSNHYLGCNKDYFKKKKIDGELVVDKIFKEILKFNFSKRYKMYIYSLKGAIQRGHVWDEDNDILPKWGLRPLPYIVYSLRDFRCKEICQSFMSEKLKKKLYVYGISRSNEEHYDVDIAIDGHVVKDNFIDAIKRDYSLRVQRKTFGNVSARKADVKVGFSLNLRENQFHLCREIFGKLVEKAKNRKW